MLRPNIELSLIRESLQDCQETTYFSGKLHTFTARLIDAIEYVLKNQKSLTPNVVRGFYTHALIANRYLSGSTTKDAPYEIEYCLQAALPKWTQRDCIITTGLTDEIDFHFRPTDPWGFVKAALPAFDTQGFDSMLVQLGVPKRYSHKPLFCVPLYHELGHFVDLSNGVSRLSSLLQPANAPYELQHRLEHFADLFAAAYIGRCSIRALEIIAPGNPTSLTHPSNADRIALVEDFLSGRTTGLIGLFQQSLQQLGLPRLEIEFDQPTIKEEFDDVRTYQLKNVRELHGIFGSAWAYLEDGLDKRTAPWISSDVRDDEIERVINDLTEKCIRNRSIQERWENGFAP